MTGEQWFVNDQPAASAEEAEARGRELARTGALTKVWWRTAGNWSFLYLMWQGGMQRYSLVDRWGC